MRLLIIASSFHPLIGGAETYAQVIAHGLANRGHQVMVVTDGPRGSSDGQAVPGDPANVLVRRLVRYRGLLADQSKVHWEQMAFGLMPELADCVDEFQPDLILTNTIEGALLGKIVSVGQNIPWAATFHEHAPEALPFGSARLRVVHEILRPSLVLACSRSYAERARRHGSNQVTKLIHHGVDTGRFRPDRDGTATRRRYGYTMSQLVIVCAGQLKPRKGIRELIQAFAKVHSGRPDARLLIVGAASSSSGDYPARLEADIGRLGLRETVHIDRGVSYDGMPDVLAAADIVAQPSYEEGLSLSLLEALSSGRPVVTTAYPGIEEVVGTREIAIVVPPAQPEPLASAIFRLVDDPELRARLGVRARRRAESCFSLERMAQQTESALLALLEGHMDRPISRYLPSGEMTGVDNLMDTLSQKLAEVQEAVALDAVACRLEMSASVALLDTCAEVGELAGAYLKEGGYSADFSVGSESFTRCFGELGDSLFSLLIFASAAGLPAGEALKAALERNQARAAARGSA